MRIGVIADTHDRLPFIKRAVQRLNEEEVELVLHAGDFIAPFVTSTSKPLEARMIAVFGNNDAEKDLLRRKFDDIGVRHQRAPRRGQRDIRQPHQLQRGKTWKTGELFGLAHRSWH